MAKKTEKRHSVSDAEKVGIGVGLTAAAVAAAGAYFLYGSKNAAQNRKKVKSWMLKARAEVLEALEKAEHMTEKEYNALVDSVGGVYGKLQSATRGDIADFKREMKEQWKNIEKSGVIQEIGYGAMKGAARGAGKGVKKAAKKSTKKSAKKSSKKSTKKTS